MDETVNKDELFMQKIKEKRIPILTLDAKWHQIFTRREKTEKILQLEKELNALLIRQGKLNTELKKVKSIKKRMMDEILELGHRLNETNASKEPIEKELETHKRLLEECNEKLEALEDENMSLPRQIDEANRNLMHETMRLCYGWLDENTTVIETITEWISNIRKELKQNIIKKQENELCNQIMYTYMHNVFGAEVMELFDMRYDPSENMLKGTTPEEMKDKEEILKADDEIYAKQRDEDLIIPEKKTQDAQASEKQEVSDTEGGSSREDAETLSDSSENSEKEETLEKKAKQDAYFYIPE